MESGEYVISVGSSSRDIRCEGSVAVEGTKTLPIVVTRETSIGDLMQIPAAQAMLAQMQQKAQTDAPRMLQILTPSGKEDRKWPRP